MLYVLFGLLAILALCLWILWKHKLIRITTLVIMASLVVWGGWRWWQNRPKGSKGKTVTAQPTVIVEKIGKVMTRYLFENGKNGCITTSYLVHDGAEFYPKGGSVIITAPSGVSWEDEPGTAHNRDPENPGVFKVCKKSPDAWGVDVWN